MSREKRSLTFLLNSESSPSLNIGDEVSNTCKVPLAQLCVSDTQLEIIKKLYLQNSPDEIVRHSWTSSKSDQEAALACLQLHDLDPRSIAKLETKWKRMWSTSWGKVEGKTRRILVQCNCGYDNTARRDSYVQQSERQNRPVKGEATERKAPFEFHGCLAHADLTFTESGNGETVVFKRLVGIVKHIADCRNAKLVRLPKIPIHPHVLEVALAQLREGASVTSIQMKNKRLLQRRGYRDQAGISPLEANFRYEILQTDFSSIYRTFHRVVNGIDIASPPQYNIDNWMDPNHPHFNPTIRDAVFYYSARASRDERLKVCISTAEMDAASWDLGHGSQIILDGTFGVCTTRMLLFICMGIDENNHGVPLALFLFSAPTGNRATHAGYDTEILAELLVAWKARLESLQPGRHFLPLVAITDTDTKERGAPASVNPQNISADDFWKSQALTRMQDLEIAILETVQHDTAVKLIDDEREYFTKLAATNDTAKKSSANALAYLTYLSLNWMEKALWESWSQYGRNTATALLKRPINEPVASTTNHLESFNGSLKRKYIAQWQRSGKRLRFDVFIHHLILKILPEVFAQRRMMQTYKGWLDKRFEIASGGRQLQTEKTSRTSTPTRKQPPAAGLLESSSLVVWFPDDETREVRGRQLFAGGMLVQIDEGRPFEIWATCAASKEDPKNPNHPRYWLTAHPSGSATCTCSDWLMNGAACKHLRALRHAIRHPDWVSTPPVYPFHFPTTQAEATQIHARNKAWYGPYYEQSVTPSSNALYISQLLPGRHAGGATPSPPCTLTEGVSSTSKSIPLPPPGESCTPQLANQAELQQQDAADDESGSEGGLDDDEEVEHPAVFGGGTRDQLSGSIGATANATGYAQANVQAVATQLESRLGHAVGRAGPIIAEVISLLENYSSIGVRPKRTDDVMHFESAIKDLASALAVSTEPGFTHHHNDDISRPTTPTPKPSTSRKRHIFAGSPEQKQKRKKSHGVF
ncbi:hypothetical protein DFP72DRAFT_1179780 [Ephemerocybe angulata]|uniref:SWIM-type domain-containing protein n=1 Tax=Ephemerocybe angulata TaxID=980116 RepID=A0A8H6H9I4_9AGAR|nr:hypothetical protein DFP72DRAFT_1179780 [Tulosesus angulatus]